MRIIETTTSSHPSGSTSIENTTPSERGTATTPSNPNTAEAPDSMRFSRASQGESMIPLLEMSGDGCSPPSNFLIPPPGSNSREPNLAQVALDTTTGLLSDGIHLANEGFQMINPVTHLGHLTSGLGSGLAGGLSSLGFNGAASAVQSGTDALSNGIYSTGNTVNQFANGFANGAAGAVEGVGAIVAHPIRTAQNIGRIAQEPSLIIDSYLSTYENNGIAGVAGQLAFDYVTFGAGTATRLGGVANRVHRIGGVLDSLPTTSLIVGTSEAGTRVATTLAQGARLTGNAINQADGYLTAVGSQIRRGTQQVTNRLPDLPGGLRDPLQDLSSYGQSRIEGTLRNDLSLQDDEQ